jgi:hypothetical protein
MVVLFVHVASHNVRMFSRLCEAMRIALPNRVWMAASFSLSAVAFANAAPVVDARSLRSVVPCLGLVLKLHCGCVCQLALACVLIILASISDHMAAVVWQSLGYALARQHGMHA